MSQKTVISSWVGLCRRGARGHPLRGNFSAGRPGLLPRRQSCRQGQRSSQVAPKATVGKKAVVGPGARVRELGAEGRAARSPGTRPRRLLLPCPAGEGPASGATSLLPPLPVYTTSPLCAGHVLQGRRITERKTAECCGIFSPLSLLCDGQSRHVWGPERLDMVAERLWSC